MKMALKEIENDCWKDQFNQNQREKSFYILCNHFKKVSFRPSKDEIKRI